MTSGRGRITADASERAVHEAAKCAVWFAEEGVSFPEKPLSSDGLDSAGYAAIFHIHDKEEAT